MLHDFESRRRPEKPATAPGGRGVDVRRKQFARIKESDPQVFHAQVEACGSDIGGLLALMRNNIEGARQQCAKYQRASSGGWHAMRSHSYASASTQSNSPLTANTATSWNTPGHRAADHGGCAGDDGSVPSPTSAPPPRHSEHPPADAPSVDASSQTDCEDARPAGAGAGLHPSPTGSWHSTPLAKHPSRDTPLDDFAEAPPTDVGALQALVKEKSCRLREAEQRLDGYVFKCSSMEAQMARMCEDHASALRRVKAEEAPRLKGEVCVMSARFHALSQQIGEALTAKAQTEEKLKRLESQQALVTSGYAVQDVTQAKLREKVRMLEGENRLVVEQLGKFKHRSIELSRYEVRSTALAKEVEEVKADLAAKTGAHATLTAEVERLTARAAAVDAKLDASEQRRTAQAEELRKADADASELRKCVELLRGARPDNRVIEGLQEIENLRDMLKAQTDELLELKTSNAELIHLRERNKELCAELERSQKRVEEQDKLIKDNKAIAKEAARVPSYKAKIESLKFTAEKATWDKKVALRQAAEDTKNFEKRIAGLEIEILKLKGEYEEPEPTFQDAFGGGGGDADEEEEEEEEEREVSDGDDAE